MLLDGKTKGVALIGSEGLHGISALLGANTSNNWAQALIGGTALRIRADVIRQYFEQCRFVQKKYSRISEFISQANFAEGNLQHAPFGRGRLCTWVLMVADCCQNQQLPLTQEQIAFFLGVQRPSVTIITQRLRKKGMINYKRGKFVVLDCRQLESAACVCYEATRAYQNKTHS